ncbi:MAG: rRNA pseudouridine synthase [Chthoniobacterales bacterium]|nr:MAG: rRNA pseudouridine synthase [Chthoniobacterales bacterium]
MRLNRFLAAAGVASRRGADELIAAGRVTVNGKRCTDFHYQPAGTDHVKVDGKSVRPRADIYLMLNKPPGFVCTRRDPHARDTVFDLLPPSYASLAYVGRLDAQSEGLLLLTNDGDFGQRLTHPRFKVEKEYEVTLDKTATRELAQQLLRGAVLDGRHARAKRVEQIAAAKLRIVLEQGMNRQIRRMLERFGFGAKRLVRVRVGHLRLGDLPRGHWRQLTRRELFSVIPSGVEGSRRVTFKVPPRDSSTPLGMTESSLRSP